eukprot:g13946.t1
MQEPVSIKRHWKQWTPAEVADWLEQNALQKYVPRFRKLNVRGTDLGTLCHAELLRDFEIVDKKERKKILDAVGDLLSDTMDEEELFPTEETHLIPSNPSFKRLSSLSDRRLKRHSRTDLARADSWTVKLGQR